MGIKAVIAALGEPLRYGAAVIECVLREYGGGVPDRQLVAEIALGDAIHPPAIALSCR